MLCQDKIIYIFNHSCEGILGWLFYTKSSLLIKIRIIPDSDLTGYPARNRIPKKAGYLEDLFFRELYNSIRWLLHELSISSQLFRFLDRNKGKIPSQIGVTAKNGYTLAENIINLFGAHASRGAIAEGGGGES